MTFFKNYPKKLNLNPNYMFLKIKKYKLKYK